MNAILLILIVISILINLATLYLISKYDEVAEKLADLTKRIVDERERIVNILLYAELTNENRLETTNKIKKELDMPSKRI